MSTISYAASQGVSSARNGIGLFVANKSTNPKDIRDGESNTIAIGERSCLVAQNAWAGAISNGSGGLQVLAQPLPTGLNPSATSAATFSSPHVGLVQFLMADGSGRPLKITINPAVLQALTTRSGGEINSSDSY